MAGLTQEIQAFIEAQRIDRGASDRTIEAYSRDLRQFAEWLDPPPATLGAISEERVSAYVSELHRRGQKPASVSRKVSVLRQFFKFACLERGLQSNPAERLEGPGAGQRLPKSLSLEQTEALLAAAAAGLPYAQEAHRESLQARDRVMVLLLYATGLRVSELVGLTTLDLDLEQGYLRIKGKGDKERIAPFAASAGQALEQYLAEHRPRLKPVTDHVFPNHRGLALTRQSCWVLLKALAAQAGLSARVSPHVLRHSFATHLLQAGMNLRSLQMLLGHSDLATTQIYAQVTPEHLKEAHRRHHPRGGG